MRIRKIMYTDLFIGLIIQSLNYILICILSERNFIVGVITFLRKNLFSDYELPIDEIL